MRTIKEIEEDFKSEFFTTAAAMGTYGVDELGNAPIIKSKYYRTPSAMTFFYRQAIAELLKEVVGEDCQCLGLDDKAELWIDGYDSAKAEIREKIKKIFEVKE